MYLKKLDVICGFEELRKKEFNELARVVTESFLQHNKQFELPGIKEIHITALPIQFNNVEVLHNNTFKYFVGAKLPLDFSRFWEKNLKGKKHDILNLIEEGGTLIIDQLYDTYSSKEYIRNLNKTCECTLANGFKWDGFWVPKSRKQDKIGENIKIYYKYQDEKRKLSTYLVTPKKKIYLGSVWSFKDYVEKLAEKANMINKDEVIITPSEYLGFKVIVNIPKEVIIIEGETPRWFTSALAEV